MSDDVVKKITRSNAVSAIVGAISKGKEGRISFTELVALIEDIVVKSGGKADIPATERSLNRFLKTAEELGVLCLRKTCTCFVERLL